MEHLEKVFLQAQPDCEAFAELLDLEQQALVDRDMAELEKLLAAKTPLIEALARHDLAIRTCCTQIGVAPGDGLEAHIKSLGAPTLLERYSAFQDTLQRCQAGNLRNARLVRHNQQATGNLLDLLRNQGETSQSVYDRQGIASRSGNQRNLTKA
ncbi:flagellar protein FlgN [uncultured Halopseudomonas sp.]|uniref:flagella synthesis protein FlgN n=1 Tax=uncultured Halopseudomonas sp. TaxID=2901193 RepID=UPI0030EB6E1D|tara:strand:+ start:1843 stop:2304 length:462 start_codon:yes stop_codon:yes gene_type:complete